MKAVEPYISISSPGRRTPTLNASDQASTVPADTGVPLRRPVSAAAAAVTCPTTSLGHTSRGNSRPGATSVAHSSYQPSAWMSYIGSHWLAVW